MTEKSQSSRNPAATLFTNPLATGTMTNWLETVSECQRELMDFVSERLAKDNDTVRQIMASKSPADAFEAQSRWAQQTVADYSAETSRILAICAKHQPKT
jgi:hypothetical protein